MQQSSLCAMRGVSAAYLLLASMSCAGLVQRGTPDQIRPPIAYVSPNMDFAKVQKVGVFPLFPGSTGMTMMQGSGVQDDAFAEQLINALTSEVSTRQAQWAVSNYREMVTLITQHDLGSGFKNLQADMNSPMAGMMNAFVLSPATRKFMIDMQRAARVDAFLIGTYVLSREVRPMGGLLTVNRQVDVAQVHLVLFSAREGAQWWSGSVARYGDRDGVVKEIAQSLAANLGKGTLRQM